MDPILEVKDLIVQFHTQDGIVHAVNGVSYAAEAGQTLGIVGESGCGKSVSVLSAMRLIPEPPGKIVAGEIMYKGQDLLKLDKASI
ncbi:MAG: ATP-binding cassette domain-containing protein, partial [Anaerolineales bacterium]